MTEQSKKTIEMTRERANEILDDMMPAIMHGHVGIDDDKMDERMGRLKALSLADMVEANRVEEASRKPNASGTIRMVADDRVTAALYVYLHYSTSSQPILQFGRTAVAVVDVGEPEEEQP